MEKIEPNVGRGGPVRRTLFFVLSAANIAIGLWAIWAGLNDSEPLFALFDDPVPTHASFVPVFSLHLIVTGIIIVNANFVLIIYKTFESLWAMLSFYLFLFLTGNLFVFVLQSVEGDDVYKGASLFGILFFLSYGVFTIWILGSNPYPRSVMNVRSEVYSLREIVKAMPYLFFFVLILSAGFVYYFVVFNVILYAENLSDSIWLGIWVPTFVISGVITLFFTLLMIAFYPLIQLTNYFNNWLAKHFSVGEYRPTRPRDERPSKGWPSLDEMIDGPIFKLSRLGNALRFGFLVVVIFGIYFGLDRLIPVPEGDVWLFTQVEQLFEKISSLTVPAEQ